MLYGDSGRDTLTGNGGEDIFVAQRPNGTGLSNYLDRVKDFTIGEDKIGLVNFEKFKEFVEPNNFDYDAAREAYFTDLATRAEEDSVSQMSLILGDLGFIFIAIRAYRNDLTWTLAIEGDHPDPRVINDDTALMFFEGLTLDEFETSPFLDEDPQTIFEIL